MNLISTRVAYFYQPPSVGAELSWLECSEYFWMKKKLDRVFRGTENILLLLKIGTAGLKKRDMMNLILRIL